MTCFFFFFFALSSTLVTRCGANGAKNACVLAANASSNASFMAAKIAVPGSRAAVPGALRELQQSKKPCAVQIALELLLNGMNIHLQSYAKLVSSHLRARGLGRALMLHDQFASDGDV
jgi:hypothetical protein